jgi:hypothetical protein
MKLGNIVLLSVAAASVVSSASVAQERFRPEHHRVRDEREARDFLLGICVGQALAKQGLEVPAASRSSLPSDVTLAALEGATQGCRDQMDGVDEGVPVQSPAPSPSPVPSPAPSVDASPVPSA